jgi:hypothetical protein
MFKEGDLVRIKDTENLKKRWPYASKKAIGECFNITFKKLDGKNLEEWINNKTATNLITSDNKFLINFFISDLELVSSQETNYEIY